MKNRDELVEFATSDVGLYEAGQFEDIKDEFYLNFKFRTEKQFQLLPSKVIAPIRDGLISKGEKV